MDKKMLDLLRAQNNEEPVKKPAPHRLLAIDPGKSSGWCTFLDGVPDGKFGIHRSLDSLIDWFESYFSDDNRPDIMVVEQYTLYKSKALQQSGSRMETSQAIGVIESYARRWRIPVVLQKADILKIASMWTGVDHNKNHANSHHLAAYQHGMYYLITNNMIDIPKDI